MNGIGVGAVLMEKRKPVLYNLCLAELDDIHFPKTPFFGVKLGDLKADSKKINKALNRKTDFCHTFIAATESILDDETFLEIELKAKQMLEVKNAND